MIWRFCWGMGLMDVKVIIGHMSLRSTFRNMYDQLDSCIV